MKIKKWSHYFARRFNNATAGLFFSPFLSFDLSTGGGSKRIAFVLRDAKAQKQETGSIEGHPTNARRSPVLRAQETPPRQLASRHHLVRLSLVSEPDHRCSEESVDFILKIQSKARVPIHPHLATPHRCLHITKKVTSFGAVTMRAPHPPPANVKFFPRPQDSPLHQGLSRSKQKRTMDR